MINFYHRESHGKWLPPEKVVKKLRKAGLTWTSYSDLARQVGVGHQRVSDLFNPDKRAQGAYGLSKFACKQWIARWRLGRNSSGNPSTHMDSRFGKHYSAKKVRKILRAAGIHWVSSSHLGRMVGTSQGYANKAVGNPKKGLHERTLKVWLDYYAKTGHQHPMPVMSDTQHPQSSERPLGRDKKLSPKEVCQRLRDAGVTWDTKAELARRLGLSYKAVDLTIGPRGRGKYEATVNEWVLRWHAGMDGIRVTTVYGKASTGPRKENLAAWDRKLGARLSEKEIRQRLRDGGVTWNGKPDLANRIGITRSALYRGFNKGMREATVADWITRWHIGKEKGNDHAEL